MTHSQEKKCLQCNVFKKYTEFGKKASTKDHLSNTCKLCRKKRYQNKQCICLDCGIKVHRGSARCKICAMKGSRNHAWKGGKCISSTGYILLSHNSKMIYEHRKVMEDFLGRSLLPEENVHHKDGNRANNHLSNLELWTTKQPAGQRVEDKISFCLEILKIYAPEKLKI